MRRILAYAVVFSVLYSCGNGSSKNKPPVINIIGYIKRELKLLDSIPYGIIKITEYGDQRDSVYIKKNLLDSILDPFLRNSINPSDLESFYEEKSFADASTQAVNITYDAKNTEAEIRQIVIYINPSTGSIDQVYITGLFQTNDGIIKKQLLWMHNKGFQIISTDASSASKGISKIEKILWQ
jgi:hypothetical protein